MSKSFTASQAARKLGVSAKALRLYERAGLIAPERTAVGWRVYDHATLTRARQIVALRATGMALRQVASLLDADLDPGLALQEAWLQTEARRIAEAATAVRRMRTSFTGADRRAQISFELPWPWGKERFELQALRPITYITGPLGSGKTRLALQLAREIPGAQFIGMERQVPVETLLGERAGPLVIDMVEHGLTRDEQADLMRRLRGREQSAAPLFLMTRSSTILDLGEIGPDEPIILCPANHGPPMVVNAIPGTPGYEAVATCLATPDVRARTAGIVAMRVPD